MNVFEFMCKHVCISYEYISIEEGLHCHMICMCLIDFQSNNNIVHSYKQCTRVPSANLPVLGIVSHYDFNLHYD